MSNLGKSAAKRVPSTAFQSATEFHACEFFNFLWGEFVKYMGEDMVWVSCCSHTRGMVSHACLWNSPKKHTVQCSFHKTARQTTPPVREPQETHPVTFPMYLTTFHQRKLKNSHARNSAALRSARECRCSKSEGSQHCIPECNRILCVGVFQFPFVRSCQIHGRSHCVSFLLFPYGWCGFALTFIQGLRKPQRPHALPVWEQQQTHTVLFPICLTTPHERKLKNSPARGSAAHLGDASHTALQHPILDCISWRLQCQTPQFWVLTVKLFQDDRWMLELE